MGNPTLPTLTDPAATGIQNKLDDGIGAPYTRHGHDPGDTPSVATVMTQWQRMMATLLGGGPLGTTTNTRGPIQGLVIRTATLTVGAFSLRYIFAGIEKNFAGHANLVLAANTTNHLYLNAAGTLQNNTTAFPASVYRLARVICGPTDITSMEDRRFENVDPAGGTNWYDVTAAANVDMGGFNLKDVGGLDFKAPTTLTIAAGVITPTQVFHAVDTEAAASTDDLNTITADPAKIGRVMILFNAGGSARVVTVKAGAGNLFLGENQDYVMDNTTGDSVIGLIQKTATAWTELFRNEGISPAKLRQSLDVDGFDLTDFGALAFRKETLTLNGGVLSLTAAARATASFVSVVNQVGTTDDLDTLLGGQANQTMILRPNNAPTDSLVVKHNTGFNGAILNDGGDFTMDNPQDFLLLFYDGSNWQELARSKFRFEDLASGHTRMSIQGFISGALTTGPAKWAWLPHYSGLFNKFSCYVKTAPTGVSAIVNINKNGVAMYASDTNAVNIVAASSRGVSVQTNPVVAFAADDRIEIDVKQTGGAADMTFTLDVLMTIK